MNKHKNKLLVGLALAAVLAVGFAAGNIVSADEPEMLIVTNFVGTSVATDEDGSVPACEDYCEDMNCVFPVGDSYTLPANEPIRWWSGCGCRVVGPPEDPYEQCVCPKVSFCGRTREASEVGFFANYRPNTYFTGRPVVIGQRSGVDYLTIARFRLASISVGEIEKVVVSFDGVQTDGLGDACDGAVFRVDLLSYALSYTWGGGWNYWNYVQDYVVLDTIYDVSADYLRAVTDEDGRVPALGFRFSDEQVSGLEEAIARTQYGHRYWHPRWSLFVRWSLVVPPPEGDCYLEFDQALLTVIPN